MPDPSELFSFTSGRFVENEEHELAQRYRVFDFNELARRAARAVQADRCLSIEKFPDVTMDNGKEVVAKIPNLNFPRPHLTIASEVATMKFAREVLCTDVPKVYDWSSMGHETAVGAEFILMEKVNGVELQQVWPRMEVEDRRELVKSVTAYQKSWASVTFDKYGSLYFAEDFKGENGQKVEDSRFVIGPSTSRDMFEYGRSVKKLTALESYLKLLKYVLPADRSLGSSHLWHDALHAGNIFVDPDNPSRIVGIIDWQSTEFSPLYFQARQPFFLDSDGPALHGLERPTLPSEFYHLEGNALCSVYRILLHHNMPTIFDCLEFKESMSFTLLSVARQLSIDGEALYLATACELEKNWETLPGTQGLAFPLTLNTADREKIYEDAMSAVVGIEAMDRIKNRLGRDFPQHGFVLHHKHKKEVLSEVEAIKNELHAQEEGPE
ncbi:hypothetical protein E4U56_003610 [Claviceps arundinis]|uniref:Altered inheritance of mitochondria protein 9, mitochondrial n=1 Tax=Claviceps arundinis TaxID=1623583 RepID=A0A9P7MNR4_9HYPO|nr:hypothetical protein E4U56_003610 [Claviceps arundinis]